MAWHVILLTQPAPLRTPAQVTQGRPVPYEDASTPNRRRADAPSPPINSTGVAIALCTGSLHHPSGAFLVLGAPEVPGVPSYIPRACRSKPRFCLLDLRILCCPSLSGSTGHGLYHETHLATLTARRFESSG